MVVATAVAPVVVATAVVVVATAVAPVVVATAVAPLVENIRLINNTHEHTRLPLHI